MILLQTTFVSYGMSAYQTALKDTKFPTKIKDRFAYKPRRIYNLRNKKKIYIYMLGIDKLY